ncbi:Crp/Fnr family transcriptional regulator [Puia sp. P3]|uniref:Crp/Fnr family transcriptional regulator n=1 Tax=Puia sp. P3 TaxID=3423952 RepID=UPI003D6716AB
MTRGRQISAPGFQTQLTESTDFSRLYSYLTKITPQISEESWRLIQTVFKSGRYRRNEMILQPGSTCDHIWFINHGIVEKFHIIDGKEQVNDLVVEGDFFSDFNSFLFRIPSDLGIRALEDTATLMVSYNDVQSLYANMPEADRIGRLTAERMLVSQAKRIEQLTLLSPEQRYRSFLANHPHILQRIPLYLVASYLSLTPESLSRIRSRIKSSR